MNKLELEMRKNRLKYAEEIWKNKIELSKSSLLLSRLAAWVSVVVVIWFINGWIKLNRNDWTFIVFHILCITLNVGVFIVNIDRIKQIKRDLKYEEAELESVKQELVGCVINDCV